MAETAIPRALHQQTESRLPWFAWLVATLALALGAFWYSLGYLYSPENYRTIATGVGDVGLTLFGLAVMVAITTAAQVCRCDVGVCRRIVLASLPLTAVAAIMVGKGLGNFPMRFYDVLLFSLACGLAASRVVRGVKYLECEVLPWLKVAVGCGALALGGYFIWQQLGYLHNLALGYHDCGDEARRMYNSLNNPRELFLRINPTIPLFADHFQPGVLPFVPLWALLPRLELTILFQVAATIGAALPLYVIARERWKDKVSALLLVIGWLVYPSISQLIYNASYGFSWGRLCLPLYFVALWLWLRGRDGSALATMLWAVLIKEEAAIFLGMFGVYLVLFHPQRRRTGVVLAAVGFAYFWIMTVFVIPMFRGSQYVMLAYFSHLGKGHAEILLSPLTKPHQFWGRLFEAPSMYLLGCLLVPLLLLPLKKPSVLFIASIPFLFICLWDNPNVKSICFWYQTGLLPILFWGLVEALREATTGARRANVLGVIVAGATLSIYCGNTCWSKDGPTVRVAPGRLALVRHWGEQIEPQATLVATERVAAHFVKQKYLYIAPELPPHADYAYLDFRDGWRTPIGVEKLRELRAFQQRVEKETTLNVLAVEDGLVLYGHGHHIVDVRKTVELNSLPPGVGEDMLPLGYDVSFAGSTVADVEPASGEEGQRLRVTTFGTVAQRVKVDLAARCVLTFGTGETQEAFTSSWQPLGQCVWPTYRWEPGKFYVDEFIMDLPAGLSGQSYTVGFAVEQLEPVSGRDRGNP